MSETAHYLTSLFACFTGKHSEEMKDSRKRASTAQAVVTKKITELTEKEEKTTETLEELGHTVKKYKKELGEVKKEVEGMKEKEKTSVIQVEALKADMAVLGKKLERFVDQVRRGAAFDDTTGPPPAAASSAPKQGGKPAASAAANILVGSKTN